MTTNKRTLINGAGGFSLVELMVVVAIIGILASVAVPQFQKFTFKARMTEAKAGLTSLFTAEKAFYGEWSEFDTRFQVIGYAPEGNYSFNIGFSADVASTNWNTLNPAAIVSQFHTQAFCAAAGNLGRCVNLTTVPNLVGSPPVANLGANYQGPVDCVVDNTGSAVFKACASATAAINPEAVAPNLAINHVKDLRSSVP